MSEPCACELFYGTCSVCSTYLVSHNTGQATVVCALVEPGRVMKVINTGRCAVTLPHITGIMGLGPQARQELHRIPSSASAAEASLGQIEREGAPRIPLHWGFMLARKNKNNMLVFFFSRGHFLFFNLILSFLSPKPWSKLDNSISKTSKTGFKSVRGTRLDLKYTPDAVGYRLVQTACKSAQ